MTMLISERWFELNKAAAGTKTSRWEIALSFSRTLPMQSAGALLTVFREANAAKAIASRLIRELTEAALVLRGESVRRFNSETASVLPAPAVGAWRFLLLRGTALDSRLLLPLLRPTASGGLGLLLLRRAAALDPWLLQLSGSPALHSRLRLLLLTPLLIGACWSPARSR
jgi:hypothetical protein